MIFGYSSQIIAFAFAWTFNEIQFGCLKMDPKRGVKWWVYFENLTFQYFVARMDTPSDSSSFGDTFFHMYYKRGKGVSSQNPSRHTSFLELS